MVVRIYILLLVVFFSSCQSSPDSKGESIPDQQAIKLGQNAEKNIQFLSLQIEDQPSANLYYLRAKNYFILHAFGLADQDLEKALRDNPGEPAFLALSVKVKQQVEDYAISIDRAKLVEATNYHSAQNSLLLAQNYLASKQLSLARLYLKKLDEKSFSLLDRGLLKAVKDYAVSDSSRLFELMDTKPSDDSPLVYIYYSQGLKRIPSLRYQQEILTSLKNYPLDPYFMRYWAQFLVKMKKYDQASSVYKQVLKVFPRTKSLVSELAYFELAKLGKLPISRLETSSDSLAVSADSLVQN
jgi:tetratricopeptide (TPR) repeat protein